MVDYKLAHSNNKLVIKNTKIKEQIAARPQTIEELIAERNLLYDD